MRRLLPLTLCLLLACLFTALVFHSPGYFRLGDWDQYLTFFEIQRRSLIVYGELPLWNPYLLGGIPGLAHPQFNCFSPYFLPLLLGLVPGTALFYGLHVLTAAAGMYLLARRRLQTVWGALFAATVYLFCFAPYLSGGVVNRMNGSLVPWLALSMLAARRNPRWLVVQALVVGVILLEGGFYALVGGGLLLGLMCLEERGFSRRLRIAAGTAVAFVLGILLSSIRLLPTLELYARFPRSTTVYADQPLWNADRLATFPDAVAAFLAAPAVGQRPLLFEQPIFLGFALPWPLLALLLLAPLLCFRRVGLWVQALLFLVLCLGNASPLNLWALLKQLPGLHSLNLSMSLAWVLFVPLSLLLALTLERWWQGVLGRARPRAVAGGLSFALLAVAPLLVQGYDLLRRHPRAELPPSSDARAPFQQTRGERMAMLPSIRANAGVVHAYEEVIRERLESQVDLPASSFYRGEWYLRPAGGSLELLQFRPSHLRFRYHSNQPARLVINQNYFPGWRARVNGEEFRVEDSNGLLGVALPEGTFEVELRYAPPTFVVGRWISLGIALVLLLLATKVGHRVLRPFAFATSPHGPEDRQHVESREL